jgi:hypothetical protein
MAIDGQKAEKLRGFLRELSPQIRAMLLAELERAERLGGPMPGSDVIMRELRNAGLPETRPAPPPIVAAAAPKPAAVPRPAPEPKLASEPKLVSEPKPAPEPMSPPISAADREGAPSRLFFLFLEPFFVDDLPEKVHPGRLARATAAPIWEWICRDLVPDEAKAYAENVMRLLFVGDQGKATQAANAFHDRVVAAIEKALTESQGDDRTRRKVANQIGTPRAFEDVRYLAQLLKARDLLTVLAGKLPGKIRNLSDDMITSVASFTAPAVGRHREIYTMALVLVLSRLAAPWQLIRVAIKAADSDQPTRVGDTPFAPAVPIVLAELERLVGELETDLQRGQAEAQPSLLKDIHDAARGLRTELDLSGDSPWGRRLAAIRSQLALALRPDIESVPGRVRRMLRVRGNKDIVPGSVLDAGDIAETEALIGFVGQCRNYANELAINEMTMRSYTEVQNYLETHVEQLLEGLRTSVKSDRSYRMSQFNAAVRFCGKVFGQEYADTLSKAAEVAVASERKVAAKA